ncbi:hypothetical protein HZA42_01165, partial [Candidatus Peregrinibacteria bacterium]|nr:hypothetical protein [Candidatus Peregrinibacteria bacterium]
MDTAEAGEALDRGYSTPVFAPMDVSLHDENADKLSYFKLLKEALLRAYKGTAGGKQPNTLLIGQGKRVLTAGTVTSIGSAEYILHWKQCVAIEKVGIVHNVQRVNSNDLKTHDGVSEDEVLARLTCNERRTGGVMRLERDRLVMPSDVDVKAMSALNWQSWM